MNWTLVGSLDAGPVIEHQVLHAPVVYTVGRHVSPEHVGVPHILVEVLDTVELCPQGRNLPLLFNTGLEDLLSCPIISVNQRGLISAFDTCYRSEWVFIDVVKVLVVFTWLDIAAGELLTVGSLLHQGSWISSGTKRPWLLTGKKSTEGGSFLLFSLLLQCLLLLFQILDFLLLCLGHEIGRR